MSRKHILIPFCCCFHLKIILKRALQVVHLPVMKLKIPNYKYQGSLDSVVVYSSLASQSQSLSKLPYFPRIYYIHRHNYDSTLYLEDH